MTREPLPDPEEGPDWYWMITASWEHSGRTRTVTKSGTIHTYVDDTYRDIADRALMDYMYDAAASQHLTVLMFHLAPNTLVNASSKDDRS